MALLKDFGTEFGVPATYINIFSFELNYQQKGGGLIAGMYVDEQARRDGMKPLQTANLRFGPEDLDYSKEITRADLYDFMKRYEENGYKPFDGAVDA